MKVLVTAASGNVAREVVPALARAGIDVRGLRATADRNGQLARLGAREVVVGDLRSRADIENAVKGVDAIFHVCPGGLAFWERQIGASVIGAAIDQGVSEVVFSTLLHPIITDLLQHATKRDVEEQLVSSPLSWTILQPCDYMQTLVPPSVPETGELPVIHGLETRHSAVDLADVADVAVKVLSEREAHRHARYELCGLPNSFNGHELAAVVADVYGKAITIKPVTAREYMRIWARERAAPIASAHGMDDPEARAFARDVLDHISMWYGSHDYVGNPNVLRWLLGREPTSLRDYVERLFSSSVP